MTDGILNVLKPPGMTSHDVVRRVRRIYGTKKAGHSGTLDPDAAGVLPVFTGTATRLLAYADTNRKQYRAEAVLGIRTDTGDDSGKVTERKPVPNLTKEEMKQVLRPFIGKIYQVPPMYSALKVRGKKLYEYARQGIEIERKARPIEIFKLDLVYFDSPYFCLDITCSKGTYIRTLLEDIASSAGTCACMTFLLRTKAGVFTIEDALAPEEIERQPETALLPLESAVSEIPALSVNELQAFRITSGVKTTIAGTRPGIYRLYYGCRFLGMVTVENEIVSPDKILFQVPRPAGIDNCE